MVASDLRPRRSSGKSVYRCDAGWEHWRRRGAGVRTDVVHGCQRQQHPLQGQDDTLRGSGCAGGHRRLSWPKITAPVEPRRAGLREQRGAAGDLRGLLLGARG